MLIEQITHRVRWRECVLTMVELGVEELCEIGVGKVLSGLAGESIAILVRNRSPPRPVLSLFWRRFEGASARSAPGGADMFDLSGKGALVTGASGGIGAAIARTLHANGAAVALSGTRAERLEALAGELGERCHVVPADLSDGAAVAALPAAAESALGSLDILINKCRTHPR